LILKRKRLFPKLSSIRYRSHQAKTYLFELAEQKRKEQLFNLWLWQLRFLPPEVLIGANFGTFGGVREHIHSIQRYSSLRVGLAPSESLMKTIRSHDFNIEYRPAFLKFSPKRLKAVHSHVYPWFIEWCRNRRESGVRWIHTYHLPYFPEHAKGDLLEWQKEINQVLENVACHADACISVSRWQQAYLKKANGIETEYIPNGVDVMLCDQANANRFFNNIGAEPFVVYVGRNDPVKNPADFVRLARLIPNQKFVMIGHDLGKETLQTDWDVAVPNNLQVLGPLSHAEVQDALSACSALVVTSKREGLPTLVLEAMTHGKPIVIPDEAGCMEATGDERCGFIYRQNDLNELAEKTLAAVSDNERCKRSRQRILSEYDWRVVAPKLDALYSI
jgi:glycosyltransferase involved in cell wall biosynthesis